MMKKYRSERKGRRNFDTALHYNTVDMTATEKTRTAKRAQSLALRRLCGFSSGESRAVGPSSANPYVNKQWMLIMLRTAKFERRKL